MHATVVTDQHPLRRRRRGLGSTRMTVTLRDPFSWTLDTLHRLAPDDVPLRAVARCSEAFNAIRRFCPDDRERARAAACAGYSTLTEAGALLIEAVSAAAFTSQVDLGSLDLRTFVADALAAHTPAAGQRALHAELADRFDRRAGR